MMAAMAALVAACGGGDGGGSGGGGGLSTGTGTGSSSVANTTAITVDAGVANFVNIPTVSVTVCAPGTSNCQVVDHVLVDTGSFGLRLVSGAVSGLLPSLPVETVGGATLAECGTFVSSFTWGSVRTADLKIAGEQASALPVQILGDLGSSNVPTSCSGGGTPANTASILGANGILGIGPAPNDCGSNCLASATYSVYYACPSGNASCAQTAVSSSQLVANPVHRFASDNNGVIVQMPAVAANGQASATGQLIFGIGTQTNNTLGATTVMTSASNGDITGTLLGKTVTAFFDTGSNGYFFDDPSQIQCTTTTNNDFYCPSSTTSYTATVRGQNSQQANVTMSVANANTLFASANYALDDLAGPYNGKGTTLDVGMPYFYGRTLYFGMDRTASGGAAPFVAF
nr:DUF3443 domain-containing protein [Burkholderia guangdongensis]